jgi:hypothetical protein
MKRNIGDINLDNCSYYVPETDPKILKAVENWKSKSEVVEKK